MAGKEQLGRSGMLNHCDHRPRRLPQKTLLPISVDGLVHNSLSIRFPADSNGTWDPPIGVRALLPKRFMRLPPPAYESAYLGESCNCGIFVELFSDLVLVLFIEDPHLESISRHNYACDIAMLDDHVYERVDLVPRVRDKGVCMFRLPKIWCQDKYAGMLFPKHSLCMEANDVAAYIPGAGELLVLLALHRQCGQQHRQKRQRGESIHSDRPRWAHKISELLRSDEVLSGETHRDTSQMQVTRPGHQRPRYAGVGIWERKVPGLKCY